MHRGTSFSARDLRNESKVTGHQTPRPQVTQPKVSWLDELGSAAAMHRGTSFSARDLRNESKVTGHQTPRPQVTQPQTGLNALVGPHPTAQPQVTQPKVSWLDELGSAAAMHRGTSFSARDLRNESKVTGHQTPRPQVTQPKVSWLDELGSAAAMHRGTSFSARDLRNESKVTGHQTPRPQVTQPKVSWLDELGSAAAMHRGTSFSARDLRNESKVTGHQTPRPQAVDWWSLGILVFELMTSDTPWERGSQAWRKVVNRWDAPHLEHHMCVPPPQLPRAQDCQSREERLARAAPLCGWLLQGGVC
eukprot:Skav235157  [mRNA]  locus=scaffold1923:153321:156320:- [translate_table: standard]